MRVGESNPYVRLWTTNEMREKLNLPLLTALDKAGLVRPTWVFRPLEAPDWSAQARSSFERRFRERYGSPRIHWVSRLLGRLLACYAIWKAVMR